MMQDRVGRSLVAIGALLGAAGIAAAAGASHGTDTRLLQSMATISLAHAPALLALGLFANTVRVLRMAALLLAVSTILFVLDLAVRQWLGHGLFPGAAPIGGGLMILAWLAVAVGALLPHPFNFR